MSLFSKVLRVKKIEDNVSVVQVPRTGSTQVAKSGDAINTTTLIHEVTAGKTFHLIAATFLVASAAAAEGEMIVTNAADEEQYAIFKSQDITAQVMIGMNVYNPSMPLEIPTGYKIKIVSSAAGVGVHGFIHGYEV